MTLYGTCEAETDNHQPTSDADHVEQGKLFPLKLPKWAYLCQDLIQVNGTRLAVRFRPSWHHNVFELHYLICELAYFDHTHGVVLKWITCTLHNATSTLLF